MDGPTWQDSSSAGATVGAVAVALVLGGIAEYRNMRDRRKRRKDDGERREREEAAQAHRISAWLDSRPGVGPIVVGMFYPAREVFAVAHHASAEPVWDVIVVVDQIDERPDRPERIGVIPPGERIVRRMTHTPPDAHSPAPLAMTFRDNAGAWWRRDDRGALARLDGPPIPIDS